MITLLLQLMTVPARQIADKRQAAARAAQLAKRRKRVTLEDFDEALKVRSIL